MPNPQYHRSFRPMSYKQLGLPQGCFNYHLRLANVFAISGEDGEYLSLLGLEGLFPFFGGGLNHMFGRVTNMKRFAIFISAIP